MQNNLSYYDTVIRQNIYLSAIKNEYFNQVQTVVSTVGLLCALCIILTILTTKSLRYKTYFLFLGVSLGDVLTESIFLYNSIFSLSEKNPQVWNQFECIFQDIPRIVGPTLSKGFFCLNAVDRFVAVYNPLWYNSEYPRWMFYCMLLCIFFNAFFDVVIFILGSDKKILIPLCFSTIATNETNITIVTSKNTVVVVIAVAVCAASVAVVYLRLKKIKKQNGDVIAARKRMQTKVLWTLVFMLASYVATIAASAVTYKIYYTKSIEFQVRYGFIVNGFLEVTPMCDLTILTWRSSDFRSALRDRLLFWKKNKVGPIIYRD